MINIGGDAKDTSYRYKMPPLKSKIEGRGNGIKTVILNILEVSKCLKMDPRYTTKFFGVELGAQSKYDPKRDNGVGVVNGAFQTKELQGHLKTFVNEIILCPKCRYPETKIVKCDKKRDQLEIECAACGNNGPLPTEHRIVQYFIKHPPPTVGKGKKKKGKMTAKERRAMKAKKNKDRDKGDGPDQDGPDRTSKKASKKKEAAPQKEEIWFCDTTPEAIKARQEKEAAAAEKAQQKSSIAKKAAPKIKGDGKDPPSLILKDFLTLNPNVDEIVGEVHRLELARSLDLEQKFKAIFEAIFDMNDYDSIKIAYRKYASLLQRFTDDSNKGKIFIGVFEDVMCRPGLRSFMIPRTAIYFKNLYDLDIISEDAILEWYDEPAESALLVSKADAEEIKENCKILIDWFQKHKNAGS